MMLDLILKGWHLSRPPSIVLHNAHLAKGHAVSASALPAGSVSFYQVFHKDKEKETLWEKVRQDHFSHAPTRMGAFFMFETKENAENAKEKWFKNEGRVLVEAWAINPISTKTHIADAAWLDQHADNWVDAAHKYWRGDVSENPKIEIVVQGQLYFPDWETFKLLSGLNTPPANS